MSNLNNKSTLHEFLRGETATGLNGPIDLYQRIADIKEAAKDWLKDLDKNGYDHSERLEGYLDKLTQDMRANNRLLPAEAFILLCAAYMHDIGYWHNGKLDVINHPQRSQAYTLADPAKYLLGDFKLFQGKFLAAEAVGWVALGHSEEQYIPLRDVPNEFPDQGLADVPLNLRKLAALLRLADEADDPYVRPKRNSVPSIRDATPLVSIGAQVIEWHWKHTGVEDPTEFIVHLDQKKKLIVSAQDYLRELDLGNWFLELHPPVAGCFINMAEAPVATFVGREKDLERIHDIIRDNKAGAITGVIGTGGIGKTELARKYAEAYKYEYPGGIFWASMKGANWRTEATKIFGALRPGADLRVFPDDGQAKDEVTKVLNRPGALLVIDNVDEVDDLIHQLGCAVMVTTRNRDALGLMPHESLYRLDRLSPEDGLALLKKVLSEPRVNQDIAGAGRVVEILGGMPLAIEIAAKHLMDSPDKLFTDYIGEVQYQVERLEIEGDEDKNVIATLTLSLNQLAQEKDGVKLLDLFEAIAVTAESGFTSETVGHAAGLGDLDKGEVQKLVGKLYHRSLLEYTEEEKRYSAHPLVRQLAEVRLKAVPDKEEAFRKNHCTYFLNYAQIHAYDPMALTEEKDGLWEAMVQAYQVGWAVEKLPQFMKYLTKSFKKHVINSEYELAFQYLHNIALIRIQHLGLYSELATLLTILLENKSNLKNSSIASIMNRLGSIYADQGQYNQAIEILKQNLEFVRQVKDIYGEVDALNNLGGVYVMVNKNNKAIEIFKRALDIHLDRGNIYGGRALLGNMGAAYQRMGEYRQAIKFYKKQLEIARRIGDVNVEGNALGNMGVAYAYLGEYSQAIKFYKKRFEIAGRTGDMRGVGNVLGNMALLYHQLGQKDKCRECFLAASAIFKRLGLDQIVKQTERNMEACGVKE